MLALADRLGKTVRQLEAELTPQEFAEWLAYFQIRDEEKDR